MKENLKSGSNKGSFNNPLAWYHSRTIQVLAIFIIITAAYLGFSLLTGSFDSKKIFTQYPPLNTDSTSNLGNSDTTVSISNTIGDSILNQQDSLAGSIQEESNTGLSGVDSTLDKTKEPGFSELFKVNTSYDKIEDHSIIAGIDQNQNILRDGGLFEKLLIEENLPEEKLSDINEFFQKNLLSSKSVLKMTAFLGKQILTGAHNSDDLDLLSSLTESKDITEILIVNKTGKIVFTTNQKHLHQAIQSIYNQINLSSNSFVLFQENKQNVASIPIFHTYGKVGMAILVSENGD